MANFQLTTGEWLFKKGDSGAQRIGIHTGVKCRLAQWGGADAAGTTMPALYAQDSSIASISETKVSGITQSFLLSAGAEGKTVLNGKDRSAIDCVYELGVVSGDFQFHTGMKHDLLADKLGRSSDPFKIYCLQRMLYNNADDTNLFDQNSTLNINKYSTNLACGSVSADVGTKLFGGVSDRYNSYHKPLKSKPGLNRDDVEYEDAAITRACATIKELLRQGTPVRVGTAHHVSATMLGSNGALQPSSSGGHFVLIVGCNEAADTFLYVDPWRGGSKLKYEGGLAPDPFSDPCIFLGVFTIQNPARGAAGKPNKVIKQRPDTEGTFSGVSALEVIAGP